MITTTWMKGPLPDPREVPINTMFLVLAFETYKGDRLGVPGIWLSLPEYHEEPHSMRIYRDRTGWPVPQELWRDPDQWWLCLNNELMEKFNAER